MDKSKPFGLIIPKKAKAIPAKTSAIFDSDSDDEPKKKSTKIPQKSLSKKLIEAEKSQDPSIYEYDSIYDDMKAQEKAKIAVPKDANKPSRYIDSLLKAADKRKKNLERRVEKKVQSEREKEGEKFKDKESFVTSAYKKKMQEMEEEEERERRENQLNDMMDVTKQNDLSGFYRHFLKQSVGEEKVPVFGERSIKKEPESPKSQVPESPKSQVNETEDKTESNQIDPNLDRDSDISYSSSEDDADSKDAVDNNKQPTSSDADEKNEEPKSKKRKIHRQIRKRFDEGSEEEEDERPKGKERKKVSETKDNSSSSRKNKKGEKKSKQDESSQSESSSDDENDSSKLNDLAQAKKPNEDSENTEVEKKERKNIYEKRTVGTVFADAQIRYFQRMSKRGQ